MGFIGKLFGGGDTPTVIAPPPVLPPPTMPTPDDAAGKRARARLLIGAVQRRGRASTILSDAATTPADKLGG